MGSVQFYRTLIEPYWQRCFSLKMQQIQIAVEVTIELPGGWSSPITAPLLSSFCKQELWLFPVYDFSPLGSALFKFQRILVLPLLFLLTVNALNKWFYSWYFFKSSDILRNCSVFQVFRIKFEFLLEVSFPENLHSLWYHFSECLCFSHMVHVENGWSQTGEHWKKQRCEVDGTTLQKSEFLFGSVVPTLNWPKFSSLCPEQLVRCLLLPENMLSWARRCSCKSNGEQKMWKLLAGSIQVME